MAIAQNIIEKINQMFPEELKEQFGEEGLEKLWQEVKSWVDDPKKLFRNYSAEYLISLLRN